MSKPTLQESAYRAMDSAMEADWQAIEAAGHRYEEQ